MSGGRPPIRLADLIGSMIVGAEGTRIGHVVDIELAAAPDYRVRCLEVGAAGWLDRLDLLRSTKHQRLAGEGSHIAVEAIDRIDGFTIHLKPDAMVSPGDDSNEQRH